MSRLNEFLQDNRKYFGDAQGIALLNIISIMDETLQLFTKDHLDKCNLKMYDYPKNKVLGCDCGRDTVMEMYEEIEELLSEEYPEN